MKRIALSLLTTSILIFSGCQGTKPKPVVPTSHQVTFIESSSSAEVMLRAKGIGNSIESANIDAQRAAIWFVLFGGDNPLLQTAKERNAFKKVQKEFYKNSMNYISYDSGIKSKQKNNSKYYIEHIYRVNVALLKEDLIEKKVLKETQELLGDDTSLPQIAIVLNSNNSVDKIAVGTISEYLQDRDFDVEKLTNGSVDKIFLKVAQNISVDPMAAQMYANALSSGSDIYITSSIDKASRYVAGNKVLKASITLSAYYTATNKEIGATTGYSQERVVSSFAPVVAEATNDAINKLTNQINKSWKREAKRGKYYKVIVTTPQNMVREVDTPIYKALKESCKRVRPNKAINNIFDYTLQCKNIDNFKDLEMAIEANYKGPGRVFQDVAKGSFLILKIADSESENIEIE